MSNRDISFGRRVRRWYVRHLDFGDPMRYVHGLNRPFTVCDREGCWCERKHEADCARWETDDLNFICTCGLTESPALPNRGRPYKYAYLTDEDLTRVCPTCEAGPGRRCVGSRGRRYLGKVHIARSPEPAHV